MLYGRLLDNNSHRCESLADLSYPVVLLQGRKSGSDRFIECLRGDLYGVLNVSDILYRNCARSENHRSKSVAYSSFVRSSAIASGCLSLRFLLRFRWQPRPFPFLAKHLSRHVDVLHIFNTHRPRTMNRF